MKILPIILIAASLLSGAANTSAMAQGNAAGTTPGPILSVKNLAVPVVLGRAHNMVSVLEVLTPQEGTVLDELTLAISGLPRNAVRNVSLHYTGTMSPITGETASQAILTHYYSYGSSQTIYADPAYAITLDSAKPDKDGKVELKAAKHLVEGRNYLYISVELNTKKVKDISAEFTVKFDEITLNGIPHQLPQSAPQSADRPAPHPLPQSLTQPAAPAAQSSAPHATIAHQGPTNRRIAVAIRNHGDDGAHAYRIPGLVTTPKGSLIAVYDIRHHTAVDLQENIDVGMSRSTDGGRTWEKMKVIMDMGEWGGLPQAQNGIGDPAVLVDDNTGEIFVVAVWTHGLGNARAWDRVGDGLSPQETAQLMIVSSKDDGKTWSQPRNITRDVKHPDWRFTLQGPGRGITMQDGTLVFPMQFIGPDGVPNAAIMYSRDHGATWQAHGRAWPNTTESQVAEIEPGVLMLNMRNNERTGRVVCTTADMGRTWTMHPSSGLLREPVCMAGLLYVSADENVTGKDILLFSNPDTEKGRNHITIKASLDGGLTWLPENSLMIDEGDGWGYSCLSMIDESTVGILYEGSVSQILFQAIPLDNIIRSRIPNDVSDNLNQ